MLYPKHNTTLLHSPQAKQPLLISTQQNVSYHHLNLFTQLFLPILVVVEIVRVKEMDIHRTLVIDHIMIDPMRSPPSQMITTTQAQQPLYQAGPPVRIVLDLVVLVYNQYPQMVLFVPPTVSLQSTPFNQEVRIIYGTKNYNNLTTSLHPNSVSLLLIP